MGRMPERSVRVLIADDMPPIRDYLRTVLAHEADLVVAGLAGTGREAVEIALGTQPDVVLIDLEMETPRAGVEAIRALGTEAPQIRCVVLTHFEDDETVFAAFEAGAVDYVLKNASASEILEAIRAAAQGLSPIRPQIAGMIRAEFRALRSERAALTGTLNVVYRLTPTELGILRQLAEGKTQSRICEERCIEASTVRTHVGNILRKFGAASVREVVERLRRLGIFEIFTSE